MKILISNGDSVTTHECGTVAFAHTLPDGKIEVKIINDKETGNNLAVENLIFIGHEALCSLTLALNNDEEEDETP